MEQSLKYRFSVGLLVTILAVVSTALAIHLHLKSKVCKNIYNMLLSTSRAYRSNCTMSVDEEVIVRKSSSFLINIMREQSPDLANSY